MKKKTLSAVLHKEDDMYVAECYGSWHRKSRLLN